LVSERGILRAKAMRLMSIWLLRRAYIPKFEDVFIRAIIGSGKTDSNLTFFDKNTEAFGLTAGYKF
jgi:hypothetical protein